MNSASFHKLSLAWFRPWDLLSQGGDFPWRICTQPDLEIAQIPLTQTPANPIPASFYAKNIARGRQ
jgi:hypothetical protein